MPLALFDKILQKRNLVREGSHAITGHTTFTAFGVRIRLVEYVGCDGSTHVGGVCGYDPGGAIPVLDGGVWTVVAFSTAILLM